MLFLDTILDTGTRVRYDKGDLEIEVDPWLYNGLGVGVEIAIIARLFADVSR